MKTAIIVQARLGSSRLPGKVLMDLAGQTVLAHGLGRCRAVEGADVVVCATTTQPADEAVADEAARAGALVFRGSETDVLARYHGAAAMVGADVVMRVTSDCPLIDPTLCARVLALRTAEAADYAANNLEPTWPHGLDCECFTFDALESAFHAASDPFHREHVTPWIRQNPALKRVNLAGPGGAYPHMRWTLDYPEDIAFFRALYAHLPPPPHIAHMDEVLAVLAHYPDIADINAGCGKAGDTRVFVSGAAGN